MEALVDYHMLGVVPHELLKRISSAVRMEQSNKAPIARSTFLVDRAMEKYRDWLLSQDIPQLIVRTQPIKERSEVPRRGAMPDGPVPIPMSRSVSEDIFHMDGITSSTPVLLESPLFKKTPSKQTGWKQIAPVIKYGLSHYFTLEKS